jgi:hypothetical protein
MSRKVLEFKFGKKLVVLGLVAILLAFAASPAFAYPVPGVSPDTEVGSAICTGNARALAQLQNAQAADDPAFGASSLAEAQFYAAQFCGISGAFASAAADSGS